MNKFQELHFKKNNLEKELKNIFHSQSNLRFVNFNFFLI